MTLTAFAALALPTSAFAHGFHHHHFGMRLSGTGTSFSAATATASGSGWSASIATNWGAATTKSFDGRTFTCAPATGSVTTSAKTTSLTGHTCSFTKSDGTAVRAFFGHNRDSGVKAMLFEKADGTVSGFLGRFGDCHH